MSIPVIVTGDDVVLLQTLNKQGATFNIPVSSTVTCRLVSDDHCEVLSDPVVQSNGTAGADWANSLVAISLPSAVTSLIEKTGFAILETQVDDNGKLTWFSKVKIVKGNID